MTDGSKKADSGTEAAVCLARKVGIRRSYVDRQDISRI